MSYRDILVYLDPDTNHASLIERAVAFASAEKAHLTGLYVIDILAIPDYVKVNLPHEIIENHRNLIVKQAKDMESAFRQACEAAAGLNFEWRCVEGDTGEAIIHAGRYADIVVLAGGAGTKGAHRFNLADRVVLECGRPILVVPDQPVEMPVGKQIVFAWNTSKEAVRAAHDALPLFLKADRVKIVLINPRISDDDHGEVPGADIARYLSRHGANADAHSLITDDRNIGNHLLNWAKEEQADLIVMGAYGRAHWRELVLGGVTAHMIRNAGMPVLMAH